MRDAAHICMRSIPILVASVLAVVPARGGAAPPASDPYGHMQMKYERTWFHVDVARVDVWVDDTTRDRFRQLAAGRRYSDQVAERIARAALDAETVDVRVRFLRRAQLDEFLDAARDNLARARDAGYISAATYTTAWQSVQRDFARFAKRGFKKGDQLIYRARPGSLQTIVTAGDRVLLDVTSPDEGARRAMIASYFAPGSDFRRGLIEDLFR